MFDNKQVLFPANKAKTRFPTGLECALLSLRVYYSVDDPIKPPLPDGWVLEDNSTTDSGYYGECYVKYEGTNPVTIVFAHRGTVLDAINDPIGDYKNLVGDINVALGNVPDQVKTMNDFIFRVDSNFQIKFGGDYTDNVVISFTGHSLGAILADIGCLNFNFTASVKTITSTTFENPGSYPIIKKMIEQEVGINRQATKILTRLANKCTVYLADVNLINSCNQQLGSVNRLALPYLFDSYLFAADPVLYMPGSSVYLNIDYAIYTLQQHSMANIYNYFVQEKVITSDDNPVGLQNGYIRYLDQDKRLWYWINYFDTVWETSVVIRLEYNENKEIFTATSLAKLKVVQQQANEPIEVKQETFTLTNLLIKQDIFKNNRICQEIDNEDDILQDFVVITG